MSTETKVLRFDRAIDNLVGDKPLAIGRSFDTGFYVAKLFKPGSEDWHYAVAWARGTRSWCPNDHVNPSTKANSGSDEKNQP